MKTTDPISRRAKRWRCLALIAVLSLVAFEEVRLEVFLLEVGVAEGAEVLDLVGLPDEEVGVGLQVVDLGQGRGSSGRGCGGRGGGCLGRGASRHSRWRTV